MRGVVRFWFLLGYLILGFLSSDSEVYVLVRWGLGFGVVLLFFCLGISRVVGSVEILFVFFFEDVSGRFGNKSLDLSFWLGF